MGDELVIAKSIDRFTPDKIRELLAEGELGSILELELRDTKTGKVVDRRIMKSKSFVRGFIDLLQNMMYGTCPLSSHIAHELSGGYTSLWHNYHQMVANTGAGETRVGILVGTGLSVPDINDYSLAAQIGHGTSAGQLQYGNVAFGAVATDSTSSHFTITRDFANGSGGSITVNEIGLALANFDGVGIYGYVLGIRDVVSPGLVVPNGQTLTVNYRIICTI